MMLNVPLTWTQSQRELQSALRKMIGRVVEKPSFDRIDLQFVDSQEARCSIIDNQEGGVRVEVSDYIFYFSRSLIALFLNNQIRDNKLIVRKNTIQWSPFSSLRRSVSTSQRVDELLWALDNSDTSAKSEIFSEIAKIEPILDVSFMPVSPAKYTDLVPFLTMLFFLLHEELHLWLGHFELRFDEKFRSYLNSAVEKWNEDDIVLAFEIHANLNASEKIMQIPIEMLHQFKRLDGVSQNHDVLRVLSFDIMNTAWLSLCLSVFLMYRHDTIVNDIKRLSGFYCFTLRYVILNGIAQIKGAGLEGVAMLNGSFTAVTEFLERDLPEFKALLHDYPSDNSREDFNRLISVVNAVDRYLVDEKVFNRNVVASEISETMYRSAESWSEVFDLMERLSEKDR